MSQQTKEDPLNNGKQSAPKKSSKLRLTANASAKNEPSSTKQKVHINVLLESNGYGIIGFVIIKEHRDNLLLLCNIRKSIQQQFDDDQLQILGGDQFKFLQNSIPISKKQETVLNVEDIEVSQNEIKSMRLQNTNMVLTPHSPLAVASSTKKNKTVSDNFVSDEDEEDEEELKMNRTTSSTPQLESVPHHFQYLANGPLSPLVMTTPTLKIHEPKYLSQKKMTKKRRKSSDTRSIRSIRSQRKTSPSPANSFNDTVFQLTPTAVQHMTRKSSNDHVNDNDNNTYSIIVRAPSQLPQLPPIMDQLTPASANNSFIYDRQNSMSIFGTFDEENSAIKDYHINHNNTIRFSKRSSLLRKKIAMALDATHDRKSVDNGNGIIQKEENQNDDKNDDNLPAEPGKTASRKLTLELPQHKLSFASTASPSMASNALYDDKTALEIEFGAKLPKIRGDKSTKLLPVQNDQVSAILANAMVLEDDANPTNSQHTKTLSLRPELENQLYAAQRVSALTVDGFSQLQAEDFSQIEPIEDMNDAVFCVDNSTQLKIISSDSTIASSSPSDGNMFAKQKTYSKIDSTKSNIDRIKSFKIDDDVLVRRTWLAKCKFTVIGSPIGSVEKTKQKNSKHKKNKYKKKELTQKTWEFTNAIDLILGLQGVHHSEEYPVWMDLVCDPETFVMISEHVRPSIHGLTIEDCITPECREKLEMFPDYLFCCIRTTSVHDDQYTDKFCIIVFRTMIITYHTGESCDIIVNHCRSLLERRHHGNKCPSPGWVTHAIIDTIVDKMIPEVECRVQEVQNVENLVFQLSGKSHDELLQRLQRARNWLIVYRSRLWPKSTMTHAFVNADWRRFLTEPQQQYWNDINDHVARMVDLLSLGQSTLESCQNIFVAKISLQTAEQSNSLSDAAGNLTAVGSVFLPLTFIAGIWGMNCKVPFQYAETDELFDNDYFGFTIVCGLMMLSAAVTYHFAMKSV